MAGYSAVKPCDEKRVVAVVPGLAGLGRAYHAFDFTPEARVEGNQDSPCLVRLLQNTLPLICMSLNKNSIYCVMLRSSKNADQRKQWWYRVAGYSAVAPIAVL